LSEELFAKPIRSLSGGYRMRVKLLALIGSEPQLMLLDEPTNYLDLETLLVLENFLLNTRAAFMLISHDREFLRRTTDHILEVEAGDVTKYNGNIDDYFAQKEMLRAQLAQRAMSLQAKRQEVLNFAARFGAQATKARQVQSRLKSLNRMEDIEIKPLQIATRIRIPEPPRTGKMILRFTQASLGYGEREILRNVDFELLKGDHIGVVGFNGAGKSTLLKALAGELELRMGSRETGMGVEIAYFAQHVAEKLNDGDTVVQALGEWASPEVSKQEILDLAGALLFSGDDVGKKIRILSGGEKTRVALGQILLKRASCLLLDEPTNHLDFMTVEALTQALATYSGTVVMVSHDRSFIRRAASRILQIRDGEVELYPGTYDEYVWSLQKGVLSQRIDLDESQNPSAASAGSSPVLVSFNYKETKKNLERELRRLSKEILDNEAKTAFLREALAALAEQLSSLSGAAASQAAQDLARYQSQIEELEAAWLEMSEKQESVNAQIAGMLK
jgi:ATP-binding cassette subfamily F protein 3